MHTERISNGLFGLNVMGALAWMTDLSSFFGLVAAFVGALAGIMLVAIRWQDFIGSAPMQRFLARWRVLFGRKPPQE